MAKLKDLARLFQTISSMLTVTLILFLLVNVAAYLLFLSLEEERPAVSSGSWFVDPSSPLGLSIRARIFDIDDEEFLRELASGDPGIRPHPVLHFTQGLATPLYSVGVEGVRREPGWTDQQVEARLMEAGSHSFVFGGSTAFGHGVPDGETVAAHLGGIRERVHLNFAVQAYDAIREVDLLLYLLRKGYRPGEVIFIDGLNDVTTFAWSAYGPHDKPRTQGLLMDRGEVPLIFGYPRRGNMGSAFLFSLPVVQLARRLSRPTSDSFATLSIDASRQPLDWPQLMLFYHHWDRIQASRTSQLADELIGQYRSRSRFLTQLGKAFSFQTVTVLQPIGLLEKEQPFLKPAFRESKARAVFEAVIERVREAIRLGELDMIDCSDAIAAIGSQTGYIDASHYSPQGNRALAECIAGQAPSLQ